MQLPLAFRGRDFRVFWTGATLSAFGTQFTTVAMAWQIYELTNSPLQIGLLGLARAIPQMGLALLGGVLADAVDRRRLLMAVQLVALVVSTTLAVLTLAHAIRPLHLYLAAMTFAACNSLGQPARQSLVPNLVPREILGNAIALNNTSMQLSNIAGPAVAGIVLAVAGPMICYSVDAVSWLALIAGLALVHGEYNRSSTRGQVAFRAVAEGFGYLRAHPLIFAMVGLDGLAMLFGEPRALMPIYARDLYHVGAGGLGVLYGATSLGSFTAASCLALRGQPKNTGVWVVVGLGVFGVGAMLFAYTPMVPGGFWLGILLLATMGFGDSMNAVQRITLVQMMTPDEFRGRVASVTSLLAGGGSQLGQLESGLTATWWGAQSAAFVGGLATVAFCAGAAKVPGLWTARAMNVEAIQSR